MKNSDGVSSGQQSRGSLKREVSVGSRKMLDKESLEIGDCGNRVKVMPNGSHNIEPSGYSTRRSSLSLS
jgi:hypothetical protein